MCCWLCGRVAGWLFVKVGKVAAATMGTTVLLIQVCVCVCACVCVHVCVCVCIPLYVCCVCMHLRLHMGIYVCAHEGGDYVRVWVSE